MGTNSLDSQITSVVERDCAKLAGTITNSVLNEVARARREELRQQPRDLLAAAIALLNKIDDITTHEFARGGEREEREALRKAIVAAGGKPKFSVAQMAQFDPA